MRSVDRIHPRRKSPRAVLVKIEDMTLAELRSEEARRRKLARRGGLWGWREEEHAEELCKLANMLESAGLDRLCDATREQLAPMWLAAVGANLSESQIERIYRTHTTAGRSVGGET